MLPVLMMSLVNEIEEHYVVPEYEAVVDHSVLDRHRGKLRLFWILHTKASYFFIFVDRHYYWRCLRDWGLLSIFPSMCSIGNWDFGHLNGTVCLHAILVIFHCTILRVYLFL